MRAWVGAQAVRPKALRGHSLIARDRIKPFLGPGGVRPPVGLGSNRGDNPLPRKRDIEAAVAAHNDAAQALLLPPSATRLLIVMFPRGAVCQRSLDDLAAEGFDRRGLPRLLRGLVETGFLSKEPGSGRVPTTYTLHLPPRAQP
jgi:hypothetical protein